MGKSSSYLVKRFKGLGFHRIVFKNFYMTKDGRSVWFEEDLKPNDYAAKVVVFGLTRRDRNDIEWLACPQREIIRFSYNWNTIGSFYIPVDAFSNSVFDAFADALIMQMLIKVNNGKSIYVRNDLLFKRNTTYETLIDIDLNF